MAYPCNKLHCGTFTTTHLLTFTKLASYSASVVKLNFGNFGGINALSTSPWIRPWLEVSCADSSCIVYRSCCVVAPLRLLSDCGADCKYSDLLVAAWYALTISFTVFYLSVCLWVTPSTKSTTFGCRYLVQGSRKGTKFGSLIERALL